MANISQTLYRGKVFYADPVINYVDGTKESWDVDSATIDTSNLHQLTVHIFGNQTTPFSSGAFTLHGTNVSDTYFGNGSLVPLKIVKREGDGSAVPGDTGVTLPTNGFFNIILTYTHLPRWIRPTLSLNGAGSMVGKLSVSMHGWMV